MVSKNSYHDLEIMAKTVGSNFFLLDRRLSADLNFPFAALSAEAGAASVPLSLHDLRAECGSNFKEISSSSAYQLQLLDLKKPFYWWRPLVLF